jgi:hypothetical protein
MNEKNEAEIQNLQFRAYLSGQHVIEFEKAVDARRNAFLNPAFLPVTKIREMAAQAAIARDHLESACNFWPANPRSSQLKAIQEVSALDNSLAALPCVAAKSDNVSQADADANVEKIKQRLAWLTLDGLEKLY